MKRSYGRGSSSIVAVSFLFFSGCSLDLLKSTTGQLVKNECGGDSDCPGGSCWSGVCVANQGSLSGVLVEVTPPTSVAGVGGVRLAPTPKNVFTIQQSSSDFQLHLPAAIGVVGFVPLDDSTLAQCPSLQVTLIPLEQSFGLPATSYIAQASSDPSASGSCPGASGPSVKFGASVAPGKYDIYVEPPPGTAGAFGTCNFVPRLFREVPAGTPTCLPASPPKSINLTIQWPAGSAGIDSIAGWTVDIVHPTTGQILSERKTVPAEGTVDLMYSEVTVYSAAAHEDPGQDLVRLTPPSTVTAPVVQFVRSGLEALSVANKGVTPPIGPFPAPVDVQGWVYRADEYNGDAGGAAADGGASKGGKAVPVPSTVDLTATKIVGVTAGIFATYSTEVTVGDDGSFHAKVLPGEYKVRVVPQAGRGLAAVETTMAVQCAPDPSAPATCASLGSHVQTLTEAGKTLLVPKAASISGSIVVGFGGGRIDGATVEAVPAAFGKRACVQSDGGVEAGIRDAGCAVSKIGVLDIALGQNGFVPRSASVPANGASFRMNEVDCGGCGKGTPAYFDVSVRTQDGSRFPWLVRTGIAVESDVDLGPLGLPLPIVEQGVVDIPNGPAEKATPVPGALIRAYLMRNDLGAYIDDPTGLKSCTSVGPGPQPTSERCIRSVLQVAETRAANDGTFELVLPASVQ